MKLTRERSERIVASAVVVVAIALAMFGVWVFHPAVPARASITDVILTDRATIGFVRLLVAATALYGLASIAVLVMRGRWLRSISTTGIEADYASDSDRIIRALEERVLRHQAERDEARRLLWRSFGG